MADGWQDFHRRWARLKPPQRPHPDAVATFRSVLEDKREHALLLGVTPELAGIASETTALDNNANMIRHIWPGDTPKRRAVLGNWLAMPFNERGFSAALGDGSLNTLRYSQYRALFGQLENVLLPGARIALRVYATPEKCASLAELKTGAYSGSFESFHGFKWQLAMSVVSERGDADLPVRLLHEIFMRDYPDRAELARAAGWPQEDIDGIDAYADNDAVYSFPTRRQTLAALAPRFTEPRFVSSGAYELAEHCPILIADFQP